MKKMSYGNRSVNLQDAIVEHYDSIFEYESERLPKHSPIEFAITERYLRKWITDFSVVADIGVGAGHYAELIARKNCSLHLVDISLRFLNATCSRLQRAGFDSQIKTINHTSATQLAMIPSASCDAVLMLGPLYHLCAIEERQAAVREAARILKTGGVLFAAGINRLAYFRDLLIESSMLVSMRTDFHKQFLLDGNLDPSNAPLIGFAHLTTITEFRELFEKVFEEVSFVGVESFAGCWQKSFIEQPPTERDAWLDLVDQTALTPEGLCSSNHFLFVGNKLKKVPYGEDTTAT